MKDLAYRVGGLLYTPAAHPRLAEMICKQRYPELRARTFCLEDSIQDGNLSEAEASLHASLRDVKDRMEDARKLPMLFVRVRTPEHLARLAEEYRDVTDLLTGYVLPKFDAGNAEQYLALLPELAAAAGTPVYYMPILESNAIAAAPTRREALAELKELLAPAKESILNIRVGGNDFCNLYGLRRHSDQTIYDIGVVRDILIDILNVFSQDYVVSGPVWEYFGEDPAGAWAKGMKRELELDRLNGFIGKTVIHPSQLPFVAESLRPSAEDYEDAKRILCWKPGLAVAKSTDGTRMNEVKCHGNWARRVKILGDIYGVKEKRKDAVQTLANRIVRSRDARPALRGMPQEYAN